MQHKPIQVILIDDKNHLRAVVERFLHAQTHVNLIGSTESVDIAVDLAKQTPPDVFLLGLRNTARNDGKWLRREAPNSAIILMGMVESNGGQTAAATIDADSYIAKTELIEKLVAEIKRLSKH